MEKLQEKLDHYKDVQIELETFDDDMIEELDIMQASKNKAPLKVQM
jgi:pterin-4a-carbinolamine dehydratase